MGAVQSNLFVSDTCNKCGVPYKYYSSDEHRMRLSCYSKSTEKMEYHCFTWSVMK